MRPALDVGENKPPGDCLAHGDAQWPTPRVARPHNSANVQSGECSMKPIYAAVGSLDPE